MKYENRLTRENQRKRLTDLGLLLLASPLLIPLTLVTGIIVAITMGRPVVFRQARIGREERPFTLYKFRTMTDKRDDAGRLLADRHRMTVPGKLIRKLSLDELPQMLNVVRGDMALVGPRPLYPEYLPYYKENERARHSVRPGITGLAQVSGRNGLYWDERLAMDADYVQNVSFRLDLQIVLRTIRQVMGGSGVSMIANDSGERLDVLRSYPTQGGLALRRFEYSDVPSRVALFKDPRVRKFMTLPDDVDEASTIEWVQRSRLDPGKYDFAVYEMESRKVVCLLGLRDREEEDGVPEMYILVEPRVWGRGVGGISLGLLLRWMKRQNGRFSGCWLSVRRDNTAAVALYERHGFVATGSGDDDERIAMRIDWGHEVK